MPNPRTAHRLRRSTARPSVELRSVLLAVAALAASALAGAVRAQPAFAFEPLVAQVQEAERVAFRASDAGAPLARVASVGTIEAGALSVAAYDVDGDALDIVFRLAGNEPAELHHLAVADVDGRVHDVPIGRVVVRPAGYAAATPLRVRSSVAYGDGVVLGAWLFENESAAPLVLTELELAPPGLDRPFILARTTPSVPSFDAFEGWVDAGRRAILTQGDGPTLAPAAVEAALRAAFAPGEVRRPSDLALHVPAGGAVALMLTPASLSVDLATTALQLDVRIVVRTADGDEGVRFLPHVVRYTPSR